MKDFYIHANTKEELLELLAPLGLVFDGQFIPASHSHSLVFLDSVVETCAVYAESGVETTPATYLSGVYLSLRCLSQTLIDAVQASVLDIVETPEGARTWAN